MINFPTRITCNTSTLIDNILTNAHDNISQSGVFNTAISDHNMIYCTRKIRKTKYNKHKQLTFRSLRSYSVDIHKQALERASFPNYDNFHNPDIAYNDFINRLACVIDTVAPFRTVRVKNNTSEWFDGEIADKIHTSDKLYKIFKLTKLHVDEEIYKEARNVVQNLIRRKKKAYFENKLKENIKKPKKLWKTLKQLGLPDKRSPSTNICLETENGLTFDPYTISEMFKKLFSNLANDLVQKLSTAPNKFGNKSVEDYYNDMFNFYPKKLTFQTIQTKCISDLLKNCDASKAAGVDNLSGRFLKDGEDILTITITQLCNLFIKFSHFPKDCKVAKLKPLHKKGTKTDPKIFRPISLLPIVSKIIEKVIHNQTMKYLTENSILYRHQSGFRKNHSIDTSLAYLTDKILTGFDSGIQKAFDIINHDILLRKMSALRFSDRSINWFQSYLSNRSFRVNVQGKCSCIAKIDCGVAQGSILGPLSFLLYVNDLKQAVDCDLFLYADDSCLVYQHKDMKEVERNLNKNFSNVCDWFVDNRLSIHFGEDKTKCRLFGTKHRLNKVNSLEIKYGEIHIKQVTYLVCLLDETLSGESMALKVLNKINSRLRFLYRKTGSYEPSPLRRLLYNSLIQPHFDYACSAWYPNLNKKLNSKLQIPQNKCIRSCLNLNNRAHIGQKEFEKINWLPVNECLLNFAITRVLRT